MVIHWLDVRDVVKFAEEVAVDADKLLKLVPQGKSHASKKDQNKFDALIVRIHTYAKKNPLNIYKKAKFLNTIKWKLRDAGHQEKLIDEMIALLTSALNC